MAFIFAQPYQVLNSISIAMLTVSLIIISLVVPYLQARMGEVTKKKLQLEKGKKQMSVEKIVGRFNEIEEEIGNTNMIFTAIFINIGIFALILFFSTFILVNGTYIKAAEDNDNVIWAIDENKEIVGFKVSVLTPALLIGVVVGFVILLSIISYIYSVIKKMIRLSATQE